MASYTTSLGDPEFIAGMEDNDTILQVIRDSLTFPVSAQLQAQEPGREEIHSKLKYLTENFWLRDYRARTWGYTILRTAYRDGDDARFQHGIDTINRFVRLWSDREVRYATEQIQRSRLAYEAKYYWPEGVPETANTTANEFFLGRFVNDIVEDREALNEATVPQICEYFKSWALAHWHDEPLYISAGSPRLKSCIVLDAETLDQLQNVPQDILDDQSYEIGGQFWVKIVESYPQPRLIGIADCYRLRLGDLVDFWFQRTWLDPDRSTSSVPGQPQNLFYYNAGGYSG